MRKPKVETVTGNLLPVARVVRSLRMLVEAKTESIKTFPDVYREGSIALAMAEGEKMASLNAADILAATLLASVGDEEERKSLSKAMEIEGRSWVAI